MMQPVQDHSRSVILGPTEYAQQFTIVSQRSGDFPFDAQVRNDADAVGNVRRREVTHDTLQPPGWSQR